MVMEDNGKEWWQLRKIWFGFFFIIFVIAFGMAQPFLWCWLFGTYPPEGVIDMSNLLLIVITLFALGLTGFSVLIYESLQQRLSTRITKDLKEAEEEVHKHIEEQCGGDLKKRRGTFEKNRRRG